MVREEQELWDVGRRKIIGVSSITRSLTLSARGVFRVVLSYISTLEVLIGLCSVSKGKHKA